MEDWIVLDPDKPGDSGEELVIAVATAAAASSNGDHSDSSDSHDPDSYVHPASDGDSVASYVLLSSDGDWSWDSDAERSVGASDEDEDYLEEVDSSPERETKLADVVHSHVLPLLPATTLGRCLCVSTSWNVRISSPWFTSRHAAQPKPLSGLLYHRSSGVASYVAFEPIRGDGEPVTMRRDSVLHFLPEDVAVVACNRGLVCARGRASGAYYVANPLTRVWVKLPPPLVSHGDIGDIGDAGVVLTFEEPAAYNFYADFHVVVAFPVCPGLCRFESFSSKAWAWRLSDVKREVEMLVAESGVAAIGRAFWRCTMDTIVCYDPAADSCTLISPPPAVSTVGSTAWWELGEMEGRLCVTRVAQRVAEAEVLYMEPSCTDVEKMWRRAGRFCGGALSNHPEVKVLRSQGASEVVMWDPLHRRVVATDLDGRTNRTIERVASPGYCAAFVPFVGSLLKISCHGQHEGTTTAFEASNAAKL